MITEQEMSQKRYYLPEELTPEQAKKLRTRNVCAECGEWLSEWLDSDHRIYLACHRHDRNHHEGIAREHRLPDPKIRIAREEIMNQAVVERNQALAPYLGSTSLTEPEARKVLTTIWPGSDNASPAEFYKAMKLCVQYGLNPLMGHLFMVPYWNKEKKRYDHVCVRAITSNRLIASRKHKWTYLDDTPRIGSEEEIKKHYGSAADPENILYAVAKIKDLESGAEAAGWGEWPIWKLDKDSKRVRNEPKGTDKGNSMVNMACTHAERKSLDLLYPAEMPPSSIPVTDSPYYVEGQYKVVEQEETIEPPEDKTQESTEQQATEQPTKIDMVWLKQSLDTLQWTDVIAYLRDTYGVAGQRVSEIVAKLTPEQQAEFCQGVQRRLDNQAKQAGRVD